MEAKKKDGRVKIFFKNLKECFFRAITPYLMWLVMSILLLVCQMIPNQVTMYIVSIVCILGACAYNSFLLYNCGKTHYDAYVYGCMHRQNEILGISSGKSHRVEREYRPWKGFVIGFIVGIPVIVLSLIAGLGSATTIVGWSAVLMILFAGWAIIPVSWFGSATSEAVAVNPTFILWAMLFVVIPVLVSGISYLIGAGKQREKKELEEERAERVRELTEQSQKRREEEEAERAKKGSKQSKKRK